jgi:hypothetical protein
MTAKEKAKELVYKYFSGDDLLYEDLTWIQAKQCALIAVDEMIHYLEIILGVDKEDFEYWYEVKEEINKL